MIQLSKFLLASAISLCVTATASAQVIVQNGGAARDCYRSTLAGNPGRIGAIKTCEVALTERIPNKDIAATHVNFGVLLMRKGDYAASQKHYAKAIKLRPNLAEAHINHAASLIHTADYNAAIKSIDSALKIGTEKTPEALYNRAVAYDRLQDYTSAYKDLKQALTLRPEWEPALALLSGYEVKTRAKS